ncbi:major facilitator superfamily domain-containing protein [Aspergillus carlsbadensis]|nr:major facilitator superfamily domain-containing protein [Aspergillus carlsbadensis]
MASKFLTYMMGTESVPGERKLLRKLDAFILSFCCLCYFANYLDRTNLNNAYVSGMREELNFQGNQLNQINTVFTVGYIVGQVPSNLALTFVPPRLFFPAVMIIWGGLTMITAAVSNPQGIMAIRFFLGLAESSTFVGTHYILGSWYTEKELGKRSGIFTASGLAGTMFGGFIQTGIHSSMDGVHGLSGWRWLFIIDGLITIPIAIYGFIVFPDTPTTTKARYLTAEEKALAVARIPESGTVKVPLNRAFLKSVFCSWHWYAFVMLWIIAGETESFSTNSLLALYMKSHPTNTYSVSQLNNYPTGVPAVGIVSTLFWATLTDFMGGKRYLVGYFIAITGIITSAMILTQFENTSVIFGAYYWAGAVYACQATFFAWCNDAMRYKDERLRSVVIASMNMGSNAVNAWWSILFYSANFAPRFTRGMWAMIACSIALAGWTVGITYMTVREERRGEGRGERDVRVVDLRVQGKEVQVAGSAEGA